MEEEERDRLDRAYEAARALIPKLQLLEDKKAWYYESIVRNYTYTMPKKEFDAAREEVRGLVRRLRVTERLNDDERGHWPSQSDRILTQHIAPFKPFFETRERRALLREAIEDERERVLAPMLPGSDRFFKGFILRTLYEMLDTVFDVCYMGRVHATYGYVHSARFHLFTVSYTHLTLPTKRIV